MLFYTHIVIGIVFFLLLKDYFTGGNEIIFFILVLLGSVLPDIDDGKSKIKKASGILGSMISFLFKHRGIFHSLIFALGLFFLTKYVWRGYYAWGLFIGYLAHLLGDALTPMGIQFLYPFSSWKIRGPIKVGSLGEKVILFSLIILVIKELFF